VRIAPLKVHPIRSVASVTEARAMYIEFFVTVPLYRRDYYLLLSSFWSRGHVFISTYTSETNTFYCQYNVPLKVGMSFRFLASARKMFDRQSKKRRWFSYKSSCSVQVRHKTSLQPTESSEQEAYLHFPVFAAVPCG
jgi:hypothetical protein